MFPLRGVALLASAYLTWPVSLSVKTLRRFFCLYTCSCHGFISHEGKYEPWKITNSPAVDGGLLGLSGRSVQRRISALSPMRARRTRLKKSPADAQAVIPPRIAVKGGVYGAVTLFAAPERTLWVYVCGLKLLKRRRSNCCARSPSKRRIRPTVRQTDRKKAKKHSVLFPAAALIYLFN